MPKQMHHEKSYFMAAQKESVLEMFLYGQVGKNFMGDGIDPAEIAQALRANPDATRISLRINSPGGSVAQGSAIYSLLTTARKPVDVIVDGFACSAAFTVAMAGDTIAISEAGRMMLHNAWGMCIGKPDEMRKEADFLDDLSLQMAGIYAKRSGNSLEDVQKMMQAETWLSPDDAVSKGFASEIIRSKPGQSAKAEAAKWDMSKFAYALPDELKPQAMACVCPCPECMGGDCTECSDTGCTCEGCDCEQEPLALNYSLHERRLRAAALA